MKKQIIFGLVLVLSVHAPCMAQSGLLNHTYGYSAAYQHSFVFDTCGDVDSGKFYREAIVAQVESCPFTDLAKKEFYVNSTKITNNVLSDTISYFSMHSSLPTHPFNEKKSCEELFGAPYFIAFKQRIAQYHSHEIALSDLSADIPNCQNGTGVAQPSSHN